VRDFVEGDATEVTYELLEVREHEIETNRITRVGEESLALAGSHYDTVILDRVGVESGVKVRVWLDKATGIVVKSELPGGYVSTLALPGVKKQVRRVNVDSTILTKTNVTIADVPGITYMKVQAVLEPSGVEPTVESLNVPGQRFVGTVTGNLIEGVFEIEHVHYDGAGAPPFPPQIDDPALAEYLEPDELMEADDPVLVQKALELTQGASDAWEAAGRLSLWVADHIDYALPGGLTARKTYDLRRGECGAHSTLLAGFCRAVGIPARVCWGCMYVPNEGGMFGQHAWTEIWMGDAGWIPVDCTAHEIDFCDSGHIRVGLLDSFTIAVNTKSMEILEYRVGSGEESAEAEEKYADHVGEYLAADGSLTVPALVRDGALAVDIRGQVLGLKEPDDEGRWYCTLTNQLYFLFERDDAGAVARMIIHQIARFPRESEPEETGDEVPVEVAPLLGSYRFAPANLTMRIYWEDGELKMHNSLEDVVAPLGERDGNGFWHLQAGHQSFLISFEEEDGLVRALLLDAGTPFNRQ